MSSDPTIDVLVIGGGQAGLATSYFLRRASLSYVVIDDQSGPGGAWRHGWETLRLFSPAEYSSLPGWPMPKGSGTYPTREEVIEYLVRDERHYEIPVRRPERARRVGKGDGPFRVETNGSAYHARTIVSATGTWRKPFIPEYPGRSLFMGHTVHSAFYRNPVPFEARNVVVVGGGNSGARILAEVSP